MSGQTPRVDSNLMRLTINDKPMDTHLGIVSADFARQLETDLSEAVAALREHIEAHAAKFPYAEEGIEAQNAWAQRKANADKAARAIVARLGG